MNKQSAKSAFSLIELSIVILVIGILVIGITKGSRIISGAQLESARSLTTSSPVNSIPGLLLWIDSVSDNSFDAAEASDQSSVTNWYDINPQSTTKYNFSQSTAGYKPTYIKNGINGMPALSFDGSDDLMLSANIPSNLFLNNGQNTVFIVTKVTSGAIILEYLLNSNNKYALENSSSYLRFYTPTNSYITGTTTNITTKPIIISALKGPSTRTIYINGTQEISGANSDDFSSVFDTQVSIGAQNNNAFFASLYCGEVIIFSRTLSASERQSVESYLSQKWGIKLF